MNRPTGNGYKTDMFVCLRMARACRRVDTRAKHLYWLERAAYNRMMALKVRNSPLPVYGGCPY